MSLTVYNVRTRQKEPFRPIEEERVGLYQCGLTVYDHMHIGHARTAVAFEVIRRWLEHHYDRVDFVKNVTDVDDKIIARAVELGVSPLEHAATWDRECRKQTARLGVREADISPHATTSMAGIIDFIEGIIDNGFAYVTGARNVYFDVPKYDAHAEQAFPDSRYGSLSRRDYREMAAGTRKEVEGDKQHPADFALWKAAKDEPADAQWDSPWGKGRPGWHIECSHMSTHALGGDQIDIHGGGQDLIFPHHENEIAQSQAKTGKAPFVNYWLHTGFLNVEGVKMSKSLNNYITLHEELDRLDQDGVDPEALRFYFTQTHYRSKIDFSRAGLDEAITVTRRLRRTREGLHALAHADMQEGTGDATLAGATATLRADFDAAMDDDFSTPSAVAAMFSFQRAANARIDAGDVSAIAASAALEEFERCARVLTLFADTLPVPKEAPVDERLTPLLKDLGIPATTESETMQRVLDARQAAREERAWDKADQIRDALTAAGYEIEDAKGGAKWRRA